MSIAERQKVISLEERVLQLEQRLEAVVQRLNELERPTVVMKQLIDNAALASKPQKTMKLCPKCNQAPGYFFHVRSCKGPKTA